MPEGETLTRYHPAPITHPSGEKHQPQAQPEDSYLAFPTESVSTTSVRGRKIFLLAQQQAQPMGTTTAQPMRSHHHPECSVSPLELLFKAPSPKFLFSLQSNLPLLCLLDWSLWVFAIAGWSRIAILCYSQINPFCWQNNWLSHFFFFF